MLNCDDKHVCRLCLSLLFTLTDTDFIKTRFNRFMRKYKYEMHCHTSEVSRCSHISGAELAEFYKSAGYDGLVVTDHFFNGNCAVPRELDWTEKVELFVTGYENAKKRGDQIGLDVFFGWEFTYVDGTDFLTYGLDKQWLLKNRDCDTMRITDYCNLVHGSGGYVVQAHPFREDSYIEMIRLLPRHVDAVETLNAGRTDFQNRMADVYADSYGIMKFCGSDNHRGMQDRLAVLETDKRAKSSADILAEVISGSCSLKLVKPVLRDGRTVLEDLPDSEAG